MRRKTNPKYLAFLRLQRCAACGCAPPSADRGNHAHHPRSGPESGTALKAPDERAIPLCQDCHQGDFGVHAGSETEWLEENEIDLEELQRELRGRFSSWPTLQG